MSHHRIRLRDPWHVEQLGGGVARHTRRFGTPTGLAAPDRVVLILQSADVRRVTVNGTDLPPAGEIDVTDVLRPRNVLCLESAAGRGDVALEIRPCENPSS